MQGWDVDPKTGDYKMVNGAPSQTDSLLLPAYYRFKIQRGKWLYAPDTDYGSDFGSVKKRPGVAANEVMENIGERALQPILDDARAKSITITSTPAGRHGFDLATKIIDAQGEVQQTVFKGLGL